MSPLPKDSSIVPAAAPVSDPATPTTRSAARKGSAPSTAASLRRHAILADLNVLQVATLMGTGLLVALGVILGGRSYITTVSPDDLNSSRSGTHGTSAENSAGNLTAADDGAALAIM